MSTLRIPTPDPNPLDGITRLKQEIPPLAKVSGPDLALRKLSYFDIDLSRPFDPALVHHEFLNNFFGLLEGGFARENMLALVKKGEISDALPMREVLNGLDKNPHCRTQICLEGHSERYLRETIPQFLNSIDQAVAQCGYTADEVHALAAPTNPVLSSKSLRVGNETPDELKLYKIYTILRLGGYTPKDLAH